MTHERRAILALIALGRITPREAERLILAWHNAREWLWITVLCVTVCLVQNHPHIRLNGLGALLHGALNHGAQAFHSAASTALKRMGGII